MKTSKDEVLIRIIKRHRLLNHNEAFMGRVPALCVCQQFEGDYYGWKTHTIAAQAVEIAAYLAWGTIV